MTRLLRRRSRALPVEVAGWPDEARYVWAERVGFALEAEPRAGPARVVEAEREAETFARAWWETLTIGAQDAHIASSSRGVR